MSISSSKFSLSSSKITRSSPVIRGFLLKCEMAESDLSLNIFAPPSDGVSYVLKMRVLIFSGVGFVSSCLLFMVDNGCATPMLLPGIWDYGDAT